MRNLSTYIKLHLVFITALFFIFPANARKTESIQETSINYSARYDLPASLDESSGLIFWNGRLWSHNDSNGADSIYSFAPDNPSDIISYWAGAPNRDWEAIEQDEDYFYIGDFGNNGFGNRKNLRIFKISKESLLNRQPVVDTIFFSYSEQADFDPTPRPESTNWDCEAFIVTTDSLYLFTKQWRNNKTTLYALPKTPGTHYTRYVITYDINGLVTDAAYLPEKRILALCGYSSNYLRQFLYIFYDFQGRDFFNGKKHKFTLNVGIPHQIEGVATLDGNTYYLTNEYKSVSPQRLHLFDVSQYFEDYMRLPETAITIKGTESICQDNPYGKYSIDEIENADSYEWILSDGVKGESNTNTISVRFDTIPSYKTISVRAKNKYGYGGLTTLRVAVHPKPNPATITISNHINKTLRSSYPTGNQWYNQKGRIAGANSQYFTVKEFGEYYVRINSHGCLSNPSNIISTDCKLELMSVPLCEINPLCEADTQDLHDHLKTTPKKKKRKFLFWYF